MKIAFIHNDKKIGTGAHYINDLIANKLRERGTEVQNFYPHFLLTDTPLHFKGINAILFFYSLLEKREEVLRCDIIQGTTFTPLAFLRFSRPVISHFGSTTMGFLKAVPKTKFLDEESKGIITRLKNDGVIRELDIKTRRPLEDIASIEQYAAERVNFIIATSKIVKDDLVESGIESQKIVVIHNAIEDYWFEEATDVYASHPTLVFLGRIGEDPFTLKLKGIDRLVLLLEHFSDLPKYSVVMSKNKSLVSWLRHKIPHHTVIANAVKDTIPSLLTPYAGGIALLLSRYEGFSLSLIEAMSQQLVPISFNVGVAPEIIRNGENGFVVTTIAEAKEKIQLLCDNPQLRIRLAKKARETAAQFHSEILIDKMLNVYNEILERKHSI